jgi:hypothetical protein
MTIKIKLTALDVRNHIHGKNLYSHRSFDSFKNVLFYL